jgi:hypothetical protein
VPEDFGMIFNLTPTEIFQIAVILFEAGLLAAIVYKTTFSKEARELLDDI